MRRDRKGCGADGYVGKKREIYLDITVHPSIDCVRVVTVARYLAAHTPGWHILRSTIQPPLIFPIHTVTLDYATIDGCPRRRGSSLAGTMQIFMSLRNSSATFRLRA